MILASPAPLRQSVFRRIVVGASLIGLLATLLLYAATYWVVTSATTLSLAATVDTDLAGLADIYASGGATELRARVADRQMLTSTAGRRAHYLIADATGRRIGGEVQSWPALRAQVSEQGYVALNNGVPAYARVTRLSPDLQIMVAREYRDDRALLARLSWTFAAFGMLIILSVWLLARRAARALDRRVSRITASLRLSDEGELTAELGETTDRDEIARLARHSASVINRATRLAQLHREMADQVAHEIRTPLLHLDQRLVAALRDTPAANQRLRLLERARADIRAITDLLDSLLDIAANEARRGDVTGLAAIDLSELTTNIAELFRPSMEEANLTLVTRVAANVSMRGEAMQITRLLTNLLDNAIKYVPAGGTVQVSLDHGPRLIVADDGPGIAADVLPHVFDRFRRGRDGGNGHGLGLALARAICERHGLAIRAASLSPGTEFIVAAEQG